MEDSKEERTGSGIPQQKSQQKRKQQQKSQPEQQQKQPQQETQQRQQQKQHIRARERRIAQIMKYTLFSDTFIMVALKDVPACQYVLRILTGMPDLVVKEIRTQYRVSKISSRDAILDILAEDGEGVLYNIEVQRSSTLNHARRTRFYGSMIDSDFLQKGTDYDEMPEVRVIYISEKDIWKSGQTVYQVQKSFKGTNVTYEDGIRTTYINAEVDDGSKVAKLMKYFKTADPKDMSHGDLSKRVHYLKCEEGGLNTMCEITEGFVREGMKYGEEKGIKNFILDNQEENVPKERIIAKLSRRFELTAQKANMYYERFAE